MNKPTASKIGLIAIVLGFVWIYAYVTKVQPTSGSQTVENSDFSTGDQSDNGLDMGPEQRRAIFDDLVKMNNQAWYVVEKTSLTPNQWLDQVLNKSDLNRTAIIKNFTENYYSADKLDRRNEPGESWAFSPAFTMLAESIIMVKYDLDWDSFIEIKREATEKDWPIQ